MAESILPDQQPSPAAAAPGGALGSAGPVRFFKQPEFRSRARLLAAGSAIEQAEDRRGQHHPGKLIPVEEGKSPQGRLSVRVEHREAERQIGKEQQQEPSAGGCGFLLGAGSRTGFRTGCLHGDGSGLDLEGSILHGRVRAKPEAPKE